MSKSLIIALLLVAVAVALIVGNSGSIHLDVYFASWHIKASLAFLGFFVGGIATGMLLKGK